MPDMGLRVCDPTGTETMTSVYASMTRVLGWQEINTNGSVTNADFALGTPWWHVSPYVINGDSGQFSPTISFSGTTLSWTFPNNRFSVCLLTYGTR